MEEMDRTTVTLWDLRICKALSFCVLFSSGNFKKIATGGH